MAFNAAIFTGMGQAARAKQNRDRDQRTTILGNLSNLYSTLAADPYWSTPQQQQLLGQAQMELKTADPGDRKASSKSILKWGNLIKVGAIPDTPPQPPQEQTILSGEAATLGPGYGSTYDPNFVGPLPPPTPQQLANVLEAGHPEGGGVPPTGAPGAPGAGMFGLGQAPTRPPFEDWAADRRLSEQQRTQLDAWRGYQDSMAGFNVAFNDMVQQEALIQRRYDILKRANPGFTPEQIYSLMGMEVDEPLPPHYRDPDIAKTVKDEHGRVLQFNPATGLFDIRVGGDVGDFQEPDPPPRPLPEGATVWEAIGRGGVTGLGALLSNVYVTYMGLTGQYGDLKPEQQQKVQDQAQYGLAQMTLLDALARNPRYPETEVERIRSLTKVDPGIFLSSGELQDRLVSVDAALAAEIAMAQANIDDENVSQTDQSHWAQSIKTIRKFLRDLGVPVTRRTQATIESMDPSTLSEQDLEDLGAISDASARPEGRVALNHPARGTFEVEPEEVEFWLSQGATYAGAPTDTRDMGPLESGNPFLNPLFMLRHYPEHRLSQWARDYWSPPPSPRPEE